MEKSLKARSAVLVPVKGRPGIFTYSMMLARDYRDLVIRAVIGVELTKNGSLNHSPREAVEEATGVPR